MDESEPQVELPVEQIQKLFKLPKTWGWVDGMFVGGNDDMIACRFLHGFQYEPTTRKIWKKLCSEAKLVVDVGTHSGLFTLDAYRMGVETCLSVEPHPINFSRMVLNLRYNGFPVHGAFFGACGDENKIDSFLVKQIYMCYAAGRVGVHNEKGQEFPVNVRRIDDLLREEFWPLLKVVKIDAENYTEKTLLGMGKILELKPDLILECTSPGMDEILKPYGYRFWSIWETGKIEEVKDLTPNDPNHEYNGTLQDNRNRFASVKGLPEGIPNAPV